MPGDWFSAPMRQPCALAIPAQIAKPIPAPGRCSRRRVEVAVLAEVLDQHEHRRGIRPLHHALGGFTSTALSLLVVLMVDLVALSFALRGERPHPCL